MQKANKTSKFFPVVWNYLSTENSILDVIGLTIAAFSWIGYSQREHCYKYKIIVSVWSKHRGFCSVNVLPDVMEEMC